MNPEEFRFNLIDDPWINVIGQPRQSLKMFFTNPELSRLGGNALDKIALLRFLLALTHAAVRIPDASTWQELTPGDIAAGVLRYLEQHHDCFELFGKHPFLQFPQLKSSQKLQPLSALQPSVSTGNKPVLTHWNLPAAPEIAELPLLLLRGCGFGFGGKKYDNSIVLTPGYTGKFNEKGKPASGVPGTLLGFQGYLHSYLQGTTLLETIRLNLLAEEDVAGLSVFSRGMGRPCWEKMPEGEDCPRAREYRHTYQGALLPLDKFYLLCPPNVVMTEGIRYPNHLSGLVDPALTLYRDKNKDRAVWTNPEHRPWRELPAILAFLQAEQRRKSPYTLSCGLEKISPDAEIHVWTAGVQVSSNAGEQYLSGKNDYVEADFYFPAANLDQNGYRKYCNMLAAIDGCAKTLYASVAGYFKELQNLNGAGIASQAATLFWELLGEEAQQIVAAAFAEKIADEEVPPELAGQWRRQVRMLYNRFCPFDTARQLMAWSEHEPFQRKKKTGKKG